MNRLLLFVAFALFAIILAAACGGGGDDDAGDDGGDSTADESALAEAMLLTEDDFPAGWTEAPPDDDGDEPSPFDECDPGDAEGKTGEAETGDFSEGGSAMVAQEVAIFEDAEAASAALDGLDDVADCMIDVIDGGGLDDEETEFSDAAVEDLDVGEFGDETRAFQLSMTVRAKEPNDAGEIEEGEIFFDAVFVIVERAGIYLQAGDAFEPFPEDDLQDLLQAAEEKARNAFANGGVVEETDEPDETDEPEETDDNGGSGSDSTADDPVSFGDSGTVAGLADIRVLDVDFDAEERVLEENEFNEPAKEGHVMVLFRFEITNTGDETLDAYFEPGYSLVDSEGNEFDEFEFTCGFIEDEIGGELEPGDSTEGNFCIQAEEESEGLMFVVSLYDDDFEEQFGYFALD